LLIFQIKSLSSGYSIPSAKVAQGYTNSKAKQNDCLLTIFKTEATSYKVASVNIAILIKNQYSLFCI
jgi:hypothetical protein